MKDKELLIRLLTERNNSINKMTFNEISKLTGYHTKSLIRINKILKEKGVDVVKSHGNAGKKCNNNAEETKFIVNQKRAYEDMNFLSFCRYYNNLVSNNSEYKNQNFKSRSYSYIYNILTSSSIYSPLRHNSKENISQPIGEVSSLLILKDIEIKLSSKNNYFTLYLAIDGISNQVVYMYLSQKDKKINYYIMLKKIVERFGIPENIYSHGLVVFRSPKNNITQFQRMCEEININIFLNYDKKLQKTINLIKKEMIKDLPELLKSKGFKSVQEINHFLKHEYMEEFNGKRDENKQKSVFRPFQNDIFDNILCEKYERKIVYQGSENNVQFRNMLYHIERAAERIKRNTKVLVYLYLNGEVKIFYEGKLYETSIIRKLTSVKGVAGI